MSKKGSDTPSAIRVRENQRRSRNQRKELIKDLQQRVQDYELKGVAATQDMQRAARKVAEENARLRSLLASHGLAQEEVEAYLRSFDNSLPTSNHVMSTAERPSASPQPNIVPRIPTPSRYAGQLSANPQPLVQPFNGVPQRTSHDHSTGDVTERPPPVFNPPVQPREQTQIEPADAKNGNNDEAQCDRASQDGCNQMFAAEAADADCPNTSSCFCAPTPAIQERSLGTGLLISCETAATIIAEMRGDGDTHRIRASLGCRGREDCHVKNSIVLELMDER